MLKTSDEVLHFQISPITITEHSVRVWVRSTNVETEPIEILELPGLIKLWEISNVGYQYLWGEASTIIPAKENTIGVWHKLYVANIGHGFILLDDISMNANFSSFQIRRTIKDLYLFGFEDPSSGPHFKGYIRDLSINIGTKDENDPNIFMHYNYYFQHNQNTMFYIRMDEQYSRHLVNYGNLDMIEMSEGLQYVDDPDDNVLCPMGKTYNSDTHSCQRNFNKLL